MGKTSIRAYQRRIKRLDSLLADETSRRIQLQKAYSEALLINELARKQLFEEIQKRISRRTIRQHISAQKFDCAFVLFCSEFGRTMEAWKILKRQPKQEVGHDKRKPVV